MLQSELFTKTNREAPKDEQAKSVQLLIRAGFIDKLMAGVYSFLPLGWQVMKKIEEIIREEMTAVGGQEIFLPALQPKTSWEKTGRWNAYDSLFKFTSFYSKTELALGPTHEEVVTPLMKKFIVSYKDLPRYVFQIQNKFRDEKRAKSGLLRTREFLMKDLYSFHENEKDLDRYYEKIKQAYRRIIKKVGLAHLTYLTIASGGTFSKYSHEFQTLTPAGEDTVYICQKCRMAINAEIISEQNSCPQCGRKDLKPEKAIEIANIFKLKNKYSAAFDLKFRDKKGDLKDVLMGCYGIGLSRLLGTVVEIHHDERGMIWPPEIAPFQAHLLEISRASAKKIYRDLQKAGLETLYDNRDISAGEKLMEADLIGLPWRLIVSSKTGKKIEVKKRDQKIARLINFQTLIKLIKKGG